MDLNKVIKDNEELNEEQLDLLKLRLQKASKFYYNTDKKLMSDGEFDKLKDVYEDNGRTFSTLTSSSSSGMVDVSHTDLTESLVGSLGKVNSIDELRSWVNKTLKEMNITKKQSVVLETSLKYDGNSVTIEFNKGKVELALTRGKNGKGKDVTRYFKDITIPSKERAAIQFEAMLTYSDLELLNNDKGKDYVNARSAVGGILGDDKGYKYSKYITLVPLSVAMNKKMDREEELTFIYNNMYSNSDPQFSGINFFSHYFTLSSGDTDVMIDTINDDIYSKMENLRENKLNYMIDGIVVRFVEEKFKKLGKVSNKPKWAIALKPEYQEKESIVTGFDFPVGLSGRITPRVWFDPVYFNGARQEKVSLASKLRFDKLKLGIGSKVLVQYRNETLSYVERMIDENEIEPFDFPIKCPVCNSDVEVNESGALAFCSNDFCPSKIVGRIERYLTKLDIKGVKGSTLEKLYSNDMLGGIIDLYNLDYTKVANIDGLGKKSASMIKNALEAKNDNLYDYEILAGIGIKNFGRTYSKLLCEKYDIEYLVNNYDEMKKEFINLEGFAEITYDHFIEGMGLFEDEIRWLMDNNDIKSYKEFINNKEETMYNFCFTGFRDKDILKDLESKGHTVKSGMSKKVDILVAKNPNGDSSKIIKAKKYNTEIISIDEFKRRFNY